MRHHPTLLLIICLSNYMKRVEPALKDRKQHPDHESFSFVLKLMCRNLRWIQAKLMIADVIIPSSPYNLKDFEHGMHQLLPLLKKNIFLFSSS